MATVDSKQKIILMVLGIVLAAVWMRALIVKPVYHRALVPVSSRRALPVPASVKIDSTQKPPIQEWKRDPFAPFPGAQAPSSGNDNPPTVGAVSGTDLRLQGILWDAGKPTALINDEMVQPGSVIAGWKVIEIHQDRVLISDGKSTKTLHLE